MLSQLRAPAIDTSRTDPSARWGSITQDVRHDWARLVGELELNPTLDPGWAEIALEVLGGGRGVPFAFVERSTELSVSGVLPALCTTRRIAGLRLNVVEPVSNLFSYHAGFVTSGEPMQLLRNALGSIPDWDIFQMSNVEAQGGTATALHQLARDLESPLQIVQGEMSPYLVVQEPWHKFLAQKSKKFRYKLKRRREFFENKEGAELRWYTGPQGTDSLFEQILEIESRSWKARGGVDIPASPYEVEYHRRLLPFLAERGMLLANVLSIQERPVAYNLCCHRGAWVGQLKTSFDDRYAEFSPGAFVIDEAIQRAFEVGAREFDFLGDSDPHKLAWTSHTRPHASYFLFAPRLKPRILGRAKLLASAIKSAVASRRRRAESTVRDG